MNPAFILIVIFVCIIVWFLAAVLFKPLGNLIYKIGKNAFDEFKDDEDNDTTTDTKIDEETKKENYDYED